MDLVLLWSDLQSTENTYSSIEDSCLVFNEIKELKDIRNLNKLALLRTTLTYDTHCGIGIGLNVPLTKMESLVKLTREYIDPSQPQGMFV